QIKNARPRKCKIAPAHVRHVRTAPAVRPATGRARVCDALSPSQRRGKRATLSSRRGKIAVTVPCRTGILLRLSAARSARKKKGAKRSPHKSAGKDADSAKTQCLSLHIRRLKSDK